MTRRLPVRPRIEEREEIAAFLERCALANDLDFTELTGHRRTSCVWEDPPSTLLRRLAQTVGADHDRLRRATLSESFPDASLERSRTGRRHAGSPAFCRTCGVSTVDARLNVVVLCPRCHSLLADQHDPDPLPPPAAVDHVQAEVLACAAAAHRSKAALDRVQRLERLMVAQESALWTHWPPLMPGESPQWRERVVRFERRAIQPGVTVSRPPSVTATLMALCWSYSEDALVTRERVDFLAVKSDPWVPAQQEILDGADAEEATRQLQEHLARLGIGFEHLPTTFRLPSDPLVLPRHLRAVRTAEALALATARRRHGIATRQGPGHAALEQGHKISDHMRRIAVWMLTDVDSLRLLAAHATRIKAEGLTDLQRLRDELRNVSTVPRRATRALSEPAASFVDAEQLAAAWVWLDATQGRLAGGPHPNISAYRLLDFDRALNPEGRLLLRQWWQDRTQQVTDDVIATRWEKSRDRRAG